MKRIVFSLLVVVAAAFAAPDAWAQRSARAYTFGSRERGARLGVMLQDVTPRLKEELALSVSDGAYVGDVEEDSPADMAGIEQGDVIVSFQGTSVSDADDLTRAVKKAPSRESVEVVLDRKGVKQTCTVKLRKSTRSYSYSFGGSRGLMVVPPVPPVAPRAFRFNVMTSQRVEGMDVQRLSKQLADYFEVPGGRGLLVTEVEKRSAAADAGLKAGDVIVKVNSFSVRDLDDLRDELYEKEKSSAQLEILRRGKPLTVTLKVEEQEDGEDEDDLSFDVSVPRLPREARSAMRSSISEANKDFFRDLHETLSQMQERIREKMQRLQERITDQVLRM